MTFSELCDKAVTRLSSNFTTCFYLLGSGAAGNLKSKFENMAREQEEVGSLFAFPAFALFTTFFYVDDFV